MRTCICIHIIQPKDTHTGVIMSGFQSVLLFSVEKEWFPCSLAYLTAMHSAKTTSDVSMTINWKGPSIVLTFKIIYIYICADSGVISHYMPNSTALFTELREHSNFFQVLLHMQCWLKKNSSSCDLVAWVFELHICKLNTT